MRTPFKSLAIAVGAALVSSLSAGAAVAVELPPPDIAIFTSSNGTLVEVPKSTFQESTIRLRGENSSAPSDPGVASRLIDWDQWFGCFSLNNESDVFASYTFYYNGVGKDVRLKCGAGNGTSGWGYKHIRDGKEARWQEKLDAAKAAGWKPQEWGVQSWDDLMSGATAGVILYPDYLSHSAVGNKWCANNEFYLLDRKTNRELYSFRVEAAWASDSDRLITSFPSNRTYC
ncbi:hypothetical protein [Leifsonia sp. Le1]|uniref:hypothetical protein n=1 Tax=Leifsonia sp. Le1 TaxID=3404918 RepID=UPI003EB9373F